MFCLLLAAAVGMASAAVKTPALLLQEGLYAEQTEGNLEKAIDLYQQVLDQAGQTEQLAAQAAYQLGVCWLQKGDTSKAAEYFRKVVSKYGSYKDVAAKAQEKLREITPADEYGMFGVLPELALSKIAQIYGKFCYDAGAKGLYSNSHIHFVSADMKDYAGGIGYYQNSTGVPVQQKVRLSGTTNPNLIYYDISARKMNTEIVANEKQKGFYQVYWTPDEPVAPGQIFMYGWTSTHEGRPLSPVPGTDQYFLEMNNHFGNRLIETFFLVVPEEIHVICRDEAYTGKERVDDCTVYYWSKEVPQDSTHIVQVGLVGREDLSALIEAYIRKMGDPGAPRFEGMNELIQIGSPALPSLIEALGTSNDWQIAKALGAIGDPCAVGPLIERWQTADWSPMKEVIAEALQNLTGKNLGPELESWRQWWSDTSLFYTPEDTIRNFMTAAAMLDEQKAMAFVAPDSHDYEDIRQIFRSPDNPLRIIFSKIDSRVPVTFDEVKQDGRMCQAAWQVPLREDCAIEGTEFKAGQTFPLDGNLCKYGDKWLFTGI